MTATRSCAPFARARHGPTANGKDAILSFVAEIERLVRRQPEDAADVA